MLVSATGSPTVYGHGDQEYNYAYAAVSVRDGALDTLILPTVNSGCIQIFLDEISSRYSEE